MKAFVSKFLMIAVLAAVLGIAIAMVRGVMEDRGRYREETLRTVSHSLAGPQALAGGLLIVPYTEHWVVVNQRGTPKETREPMSQAGVLYVLPETLDVNGQLVPDVRKRGVFRVNGYAFSGALNGALRMPSAASVKRSVEGSEIQFGRPSLVLSVASARGLRAVRMNAGGHALNVTPGTGMSGLPAGVSALLANVPEPGSTIDFEIVAEVAGAQRLDVIPLGMESRLVLHSDWPHPSFIGDFLPAERTVRSSGFDAAWRTSAVASNARVQWLARAGTEPARQGGVDTVAQDDGPAVARSVAGVESFAVALVDPVDAYVMSDRATKYALLIVGCTLALFAVYELIKGLRVHPVQYLLVGFAMVLFFMLLLALSEHIGFDAAYGSASVVCVGLISYYVSAALGSMWRASGFALLLSGLYGALYGILCSEQNALLLGTLLLFGVLAGVMVLSRRVDWNALLQPASAVAVADA